MPGLLGSLSPCNMINSIRNSHGKKLKNKDPKELNNILLIDTQLNISGTKFKKRNFINYRFRNNPNKQWDKRYHKSD